jgi:hypothetical protein
LVFWKSLESSFGTDSRFGHRSKKICWPFVLGILDDCKCSENFLAPTITTPILLSATFSIQIVDGLRCHLSICFWREAIAGGTMEGSDRRWKRAIAGGWERSKVIFPFVFGGKQLSYHGWRGAITDGGLGDYSDLRWREALA